MRHRVTTKRLKRTASHRKALLKNMSASLIDHEKIETTLDKAKYLRPYIEKLVTKAKKTHVANDKIHKFNTIKDLKDNVNSDDSVKKLVDEIAPRYVKRNGGYTRIIQTGNRDGDNAKTATIEFVESTEK